MHDFMFFRDFTGRTCLKDDAVVNLILGTLGLLAAPPDILSFRCRQTQWLQFA